MKKVTISDLSEMTGISRSTVSRVLNNNPNVHTDIKRQVEEAIEKSGYQRKAAKLKLTAPVTSVNIATTVPVGSPDQFYTIMMNEFQTQLSDMGIEPKLTLINGKIDQQQILKKLESAESVLMLGPELPEVAHKLADQEKPIVLVNGYDDKMRLSSVSLDYELGGELAAKHLIEYGHKKLAMLTAQTRPSIRKRTYGFERKAKELGAESVEIIDIIEMCNKLGHKGLAEKIMVGKAGADFGASLILPELLDSGMLDDATAIFCLCDRTAITLIEELDNRGIRVPDDVSVIGFDNLSISSMVTPTLSSIGGEISYMVKSTIDALFHEFNNTSDIATRINIGVQLYSRDSVKKLE
jgi:DNA-binding LacI/PurR family transcriptional regulator